ARSANTPARVSARATSVAPTSVRAVSSKDMRRPLPGVHVHGHRDTVRDHVEDGRALLRSIDELAQLLRGRVARDPKGDADALEPVAVLVREPERPLDVHVALERGLDLGEMDTASGGHVHERRRQTRGQRMQEELGRIRSRVGAQEDCGLARIDHEGFAARGVLRAGRVEVPDRRSVVGAADPSVARAELELSEYWLLLEDD